MIRRLLALFGLFILAVTPARASAYGRMQMDASTKSTYMAVTALTAPAASCTDFVEIKGSSTKKVKLLRIEATFRGSANEANYYGYALIKRSSASTGGTSTTVTPVPLDSNFSAATHSIKCFTANPTVGTAVGTIARGLLYSALSVAPGNPAIPSDRGSQILFDACNSGAPIVLNSESEVLCLNFESTSTSVTTPRIAVTVYATEED